VNKTSGLSAFEFDVQSPAVAHDAVQLLMTLSSSIDASIAVVHAPRAASSALSASVCLGRVDQHNLKQSFVRQ
jgi:hypothetical protein